ncbi:MAG: hypothetical protein R3F30_09825 [Planctomycetota bacterium]
MQLERALSEISEIHAQVLRSFVFRGYRALPMALTGLLALAAAALEPTLVGEAGAAAHASYWVGTCLIAVGLVGGDLCFLLATGRTGPLRRTLPVLLQFAPVLLAGALLHLCLIGRAPELLPGLWGMVYGLGLFCLRPHLPRATGWVGLGFLAGGAALIAAAGPTPSPWGMGLLFGLGQAAFAVTLHVGIERRRP